tara:strand:+ start:192 stop:437 length:246 start_codon:yes stop_codon:yes gene_type:complete
MKNKFKGFYDSNTDSYIIPKVPGFYIEYNTHSGDVGFVKVESRLPKGSNIFKESKEALKRLNPDEDYQFAFFRELTEEELK